MKGVSAYMMFHNRRIVHRDIGAKSEKQMKDMIQEALEIINQTAKRQAQ